MGCSVSQLTSGEPQLTPKPTAPPPSPRPTIETTTIFDHGALTASASSASTVAGGLGASSARAPADAAREAFAQACVSLARAVGTDEGEAPQPALAIVVCGKAVTDAEEVRCEVIRAVPEALLHGAASVEALCVNRIGPARDPCGGNQRSPSDCVGCLLLEAGEGCFAAAWDDTGDALYAARWLQEQMPNPQAVIMAALPGARARSISAVQSVFPGTPVHVIGAAEESAWVTLSHLGSAENGVSLVGIGMQVGFGAAKSFLHLGGAENAKDFYAPAWEVYETAMLRGSLQRASAGILLCSGCLDNHALVEVCEQFGDLPILAMSSRAVDTPGQGSPSPSIGMMLFGERRPLLDSQEIDSEDPAKTVCSTEEGTASPHGSATDTSCTASLASRDLCSP